MKGSHLTHRVDKYCSNYETTLLQSCTQIVQHYLRTDHLINLLVGNELITASHSHQNSNLHSSCCCCCFVNTDKRSPSCYQITTCVARTVELQCILVHVHVAKSLELYHTVMIILPLSLLTGEKFHVLIGHTCFCMPLTRVFSGWFEIPFKSRTSDIQLTREQQNNRGYRSVFSSSFLCAIYAHWTGLICLLGPII